MSKKVSSPGIFKTLTLILGMVLLLMLVVQSAFLWQYRKAVEEKALVSLETVAQQVRTSVAYEFESINTSAISSFRNPGLTQLLISPDADSTGGEMALSEMMGLNRSIVAVRLLDKEMNAVCDVARANIDEKAVDAVFERFSGAAVVSEPAGDGGIYFSYLHPILYRADFDLLPPDADTHAEQIGYILFVCRLNSVKDIDNSEGYEVLVSRDGVILASGAADSESLDREDYYSIEYTLDGGYTVTTLTPKTYVRSKTDSVTAQTGILLFAVTLAALGFAYFYLRRGLARPIKRMETDLLAVSDAGHSHRLRGYPNNEIGQVAEKVNSMLDHLEDARSAALAAQREKYESEILLRKAELDYIHAQVNPHFLYNSLETVCGMAAMGRTDLVIDTCTALSSLFRYSIHESDMVPLEEELKYARNYFYVMNHRYKGELELKINISDADRAAPVPKMILQPVLENSLKHGKMNTAQHGIVCVDARRTKDCLVISIRDNGAGIAAGELENIRQQISRSVRIDKAHGLGLRNLNARLKMSCGGSSRIEIESEENEYTELRLFIQSPGETEAQARQG